MMRAPAFWYRKGLSLPAILLAPLTVIWRLGSALKAIAAKPIKPSVPVVVIGNLTVGGTGKTPLVAALAEEALNQGRHPVILMRGHGGSIAGPHLVSAEDTAEMIGDEASWLRPFAPVVIARHRGKGAQFITETMPECDLIIMDDGLQNPTITPSLRVGVFNAQLGLGNGMVVPAGPLRQPFYDGLRQLDAAVINGEDDGLAALLRAKRFDGVIFNSRRHLKPNDIRALKNKPVLAFAGIGHPEGFFTMLRDAGITLSGSRAFPDHHPYSSAEIKAMSKQAAADGALLVTTEKDHQRLSADDQRHIISVGLETSLDGSLLDMVMKARV